MKAFTIMITITNQQPVVLDLTQLKQMAQKILDELNYANYDLGILLADLGTMQQYNEQYRTKNKPTDILSFPYHPSLQAGDRIHPQSEDDKNLGDLIICPQYVLDNLDQWNTTLDRRLTVLLIHGICHLLGYDHTTEAEYQQMQTLENKLLTQITQ